MDNVSMQHLNHVTDNKIRMSDVVQDVAVGVLRSIKLSSQCRCHCLHHKAVSLDCRELLLVSNHVVNFDD